MYRAASGALVFGAGTVQWSWGLDGNHDRGASRRPTRDMQQATVNLLADMACQPDTLQSGLVAATASTDTTPPTSASPSPLDGDQRRRRRDDHDHRHRHRRRRRTGGQSPGSRSRSTAAATWHPAPGPRQLDLHVDAGRRRERSRSRPAPSTTAATSRRPSAGTTVTVAPSDLPVLDLGRRRSTASRQQRRAARSRSASSSAPTSAATSPGFRFYKSVRQHRHAHRPPVDGGRHPARGAPPSPARRRPAGSRSTSAPRSRSTPNTTYVVSYHAPNRLLRGEQRLLRERRRRQRPPARARGRRRRAERRLHVRAPAACFPADPDTFQSSNYWVDVVFDTDVGPDTTPPAISAALAGAAAPVASPPARTSRRPSTSRWTRARSTAPPFELRDPRRTPSLPATVSYTTRHTRTATLDPERAALALDRLHGDGQGRRRRRHATRPATRSAPTDAWSFTTAAPPPPPPDEGPGGPILVDLQRRQPVRPLLRRDPARRGAQRVHRDRHLDRHAADARRATTS